MFHKLVPKRSLVLGLDEGYLRDMLEAVDKILVRTATLAKADYDADEDR
ncbi:MAG: hypothetical protein O2820_25400 [Planctomycetota bacterium]|nr:hypothetical protein [Planctomycetota bacterium]